MKDLSYLTDSYDEKIKKIKEFGAPLNFVFITDMHNRLNEHEAIHFDPPDKRRGVEYAVDAIASIQYILDRCPEISFVVNGGDIGNDYAHTQEEMLESAEEVMGALYKLSVPVHSCIGNHDDGLGNAYDLKMDTNKHVLTPEELHRLCMKYNPTDENYYYHDVDAGDEHYRLIFMNTADKPYYKDNDGQYPFGWRNEVSAKQALWLEESLCTDRRIIVFSHQPLHNEWMMGTEGMPWGIKPYDDLLNGPRVYYDVKSNKNVVMLVAGHLHYDNLIYDGKLLSVTTLCSFVQEWAPSCPERKIGTPTETAFDVFSIKGNDVRITRFGAGEDRHAVLLKVE